MIHTTGPRRRTLLAIRLRQLGDVLATLGTLRALRNAAPGCRIVFVVDGHYHSLLRNVEYIDILLPEPPKITGLYGAAAFDRYIDDLRQLDIDVALDFHSNTRSAVLSWLSGAPSRIGFDVRVRKMLYTDVEPRAIFENGRLIPRTSHESALSLGRRMGIDELAGSVQNTIPLLPGDLEEGRRLLLEAGLPVEVINSKRIVGINPGNPYPAKAWDDSRFVELAKRLRGEGRTVVVLWGPGEKNRAENIVQRSGTGIYLSPPLELDKIPGVLHRLSVVVTIDSGLKHLAVAVGVPTVTLFGPTHPHEWHMGGSRDRFLFAGLTCSPCRLLECPFGAPCMSRLSPDAVMREVSRIEGSVDPQ